MDNQPHRTHTGGLYCSEGSTHVSRPTVRIREPPGGDSSWNFLNPTGSSTSSVTQQKQSGAASSATNYHSRFSKKETVVTGKIGHMPGASAEQTSTTPPPVEVVETTPSAADKNNDGSLGAIYCVEGSQVRTRPSVKIRGETRRNYNILSFE